MITIHNALTRAFLGYLHPTECTVTEEAGGDYSVELVHPIDAEDVWTLIQNERIIQVPVPVRTIPAIKLAPISYWRVKSTVTKTTLWERLPYTVRVQPQGNGDSYQWGQALVWGLNTYYGVGARVRYIKTVYECTYAHVSTSKDLPGSSSKWKAVYRFDGDTNGQTEDQQNSVVRRPGSKLIDLQPGQALTKVQDYNVTYMRVKCMVSGKTYEGYVTIADCELVSNGVEEGHGEIWSMTEDSHVYAEPKTNAAVTEDILEEATYTVIRKHDEMWNYGTADGTGTGGYFLRSASTKQEDGDGETPITDDVVPSRTITAQLFRIFSVNVTMDNEVRVEARHISYDLEGYGLSTCEVSEASPPMALDVIKSAVMDETDRLMLTDFTSEDAEPVTGDWSWKNAVSALLDPKDGLAFKLKACVIRDNDDVFLLKSIGNTVVYHIMYGVNLLGVDWTEDYDGIINRIIPKGKDKEGAPLFLPEEHIDSNYLSQYAVIRTEILDVGCQIDKEKTLSDGTKKKYTEEMCFDEMREEAGKRFKDDMCDLPQTTVRIEFLKLGDTEEYRQYRGAESLAMYDWVRVYHEDIGMDFALQVIGYEWDAVKGRYNSIDIGRPFSVAGHGRGISSWELGNQAVDLRNLSEPLKKTLGV